MERFLGPVQTPCKFSMFSQMTLEATELGLPMQLVKWSLILLLWQLVSCYGALICYITNYSVPLAAAPGFIDGCFSEFGCSGDRIGLRATGSADIESRECCVNTPAMSYSRNGQCFDCTGILLYIFIGSMHQRLGFLMAFYFLQCMDSLRTAVKSKRLMSHTPLRSDTKNDLAQLQIFSLVAFELNRDLQVSSLRRDKG